MNKEVHFAEVEQQPPPMLKLVQEWFAGAITNQLGENHSIQSRPEGSDITLDARNFIRPTENLQPHERLQIYNQQYWWRLLNTLHACFPLVTRLFGSQVFNEKIGTPYLLQFPPNHWSLNLLGERLPKWILECYKEPDQSLIYHSACLDWAFAASYVSVAYTSLDLVELGKEKEEDLLSYTFYLQPHIHLFTWQYDLFRFRGSFLKQGLDHWVKHRFPKLPKRKTYTFVLYRNANNQIAWREISRGEYLLLERFKTGSTVLDACNYVESLDQVLYEEIASNLQKWLQQWAQAGWLTLYMS
jgi:Putative DNA-binding domain